MIFHPQSLAMYVPPDEPVHDMGEVNMSFQADDHRGGNIHNTGIQTQQGTNLSVHPSGGQIDIVDDDDDDDDAVASVNPIYQR